MLPIVSESEISSLISFTKPNFLEYQIFSFTIILIFFWGGPGFQLVYPSPSILIQFLNVFSPIFRVS